jgi:hypothetical protein
MGRGRIGTKTAAELNIKLAVIETLNLAGAVEPCPLYRGGRDTIGADCQLNIRWLPPAILPLFIYTERRLNT